MLINVSDIQIKNRIRKDYGDIGGLAESIRKNGLIQPISITPDYILIAGERRLRAVQSLGEKQIEANAVQVYEYEDILLREIAENEQRKDFTPSERVAYGKELEQIETLKAKERQGERADLKSTSATTVANVEKGKTDDIVGAKVGMSGESYRRAKRVVESKNEELIKQMDEGKIGIATAYNKVRPKEDKPAKKEIDNPKVEKKIFSRDELDETGFPKVTPIRPEQESIFSISLFKEVVNSFICEINPLAYGATIFKKTSTDDKTEFIQQINEVRNWLNQIENQINNTQEV